jgi:hypothetical protein
VLAARLIWIRNIRSKATPSSLATAGYDWGTEKATLKQSKSWQVDAIVNALDSHPKVRIRRRVANPASLKRTVKAIVPRGSTVLITLDEAPRHPEAFVGGQLTVGAFKGTILPGPGPAPHHNVPNQVLPIAKGRLDKLEPIVKGERVGRVGQIGPIGHGEPGDQADQGGPATPIDWTVAVAVQLSGDNGASVVFGNTPEDPARILQSPTHPSLFVTVAELPASELVSAQTIVVADPLTRPTTVQLAEYRAQVVYAGLEGPLGGPVQAVLLPETPAKSPPFSASLLGIDYYDRAVIQVDLRDESKDLCEVWWAHGLFGDGDEVDFFRSAVRGDAGPRLTDPKSQKTLFDTLSLPIRWRGPGPAMLEMLPDDGASDDHARITIGVCALNGAAGRGEFSLLSFKLAGGT